MRDSLLRASLLRIPIIPFRIMRYLLLCLALLTSCAGPRRIVIRNETGVKATVAWGLRPDRRMNELSTFSRVDTLYTPLGIEGNQRETGLVFGKGAWNVNEYRRAAERVAFIEVVTEDDSVLFYVDKNDSLEALFADGVRGLRRREIWVIVD